MSDFRRKLLIQNALKASSSSGILPSGYTQLQWIENQSKIGAYIDTGTKISTKTNIKVVAQLSNNNEDYSNPCFIWGASSSYSPNKDVCGFIILNSSHGKALFTHDYATFDHRPFRNHKIVYEKNNRKFSIIKDNVIQWKYEWQSYFNASPKGNLLIGAMSQENSIVVEQNFIGSFYSATIEENGVLLRNLIPCKSPNGEVGMYDLVEGKFYGSATDVPFIAGDIA